MIFTPNLTKIGYVEKTHGTNGAVKLVLNIYKNSILKKMEFLFLEIAGNKVPFKVESYNITADIVKFTQFNNPMDANEILGCTVMIEDFVVPVYDEDFKPIDFEIINQDGLFIGKVIELIPIPNNPQLLIAYQDRQVELPWHIDFILAIDQKKKTMQYRIIEGILDL